MTDGLVYLRRMADDGDGVAVMLIPVVEAHREARRLHLAREAAKKQVVCYVCGMSYDDMAASGRCPTPIEVLQQEIYLCQDCIAGPIQQYPEGNTVT